MNNGIIIILGGAGFCPSTVSPNLVFFEGKRHLNRCQIEKKKGEVWDSLFFFSCDFKRLESIHFQTKLDSPLKQNSTQHTWSLPLNQDLPKKKNVQPSRTIFCQGTPPDPPNKRENSKTSTSCRLAHWTVSDSPVWSIPGSQPFQKGSRWASMWP